MADPVKIPAPPGGFSKDLIDLFGEERGHLEALRHPYDPEFDDPEQARLDRLMKDMLTEIEGPQEIAQRRRDESVDKIEEEEDRMIAVPPEEEPRRDPFKSFLPPPRRKRPVPAPAPAVAEELPEDDEELFLSRLP